MEDIDKTFSILRRIDFDVLKLRICSRKNLIFLMSAGPLSEPYFKNTGWTREEFNEELYIRWYNKRKIDGNKFVRKT